MGVTWQTLRGNTSGFAVVLTLAEGAEDDWLLEEPERKSWGSFALWVHDTNLCAHVEQGEPMAEVHWYLLPIAEWLIDNWEPLFHEERLPFENDSPTGTAALARTSYIPPFLELDEQVRRAEVWQRWWRRHSLRASASGGLVPDVVIRRWGDHVELSTGEERQPGTPEHFLFDVPSRVWRVPVAAIADHLHEALGELLQELTKRCANSERLAQLRQRWSALRGGNIPRRLTLLAGSASDESPDWLERVLMSLDLDASLVEENVALTEQPKVLALFGSYAPQVSEDDVTALLGLAQRANSTEPAHVAKGLLAVTIDPADVLGLPPGEQGSILGEEAYSHVVDDGSHQVDIAGLLDSVGVSVTSTSLTDRRVRAVSLLAEGAAPLIAVNENYERGKTPGVVRFTLAHELGHLLLDRQRSRELAIVSGPWAPVDIEQRANAFAAAFLMPEVLVRRTLTHLVAPPSDFAALSEMAQRLGVSVSSVADRMRNLGLLADEEADALKGEAAYRRQLGQGEA